LSNCLYGKKHEKSLALVTRAKPSFGTNSLSHPNFQPCVGYWRQDTGHEETKAHGPFNQLHVNQAQRRGRRDAHSERSPIPVTLSRWSSRPLKLMQRERRRREEGGHMFKRLSAGLHTRGCIRVAVDTGPSGPSRH